MNTVLMYVIMCLVCRFKAPGGGFKNLKFDLLYKYTHLSDLVERYVSGRNLRSMNGHRLVEVKHNLRNYGFRSFSVAAPQLWNALPSDIRACDNISEFKRKLKAYLFRKAFS